MQSRLLFSTAMCLNVVVLCLHFFAHYFVITRLNSSCCKNIYHQNTLVGNSFQVFTARSAIVALILTNSNTFNAAATAQFTIAAVVLAYVFVDFVGKTLNVTGLLAHAPYIS